MFMLTSRLDAAVCEPEMVRMLAKGYIITKIHHLMKFEKGFPFDAYVGTLGKMKAETKDPVFRKFIKLLMNGLYGRIGMGSKSLSGGAHSTSNSEGRVGEK